MSALDIFMQVLGYMGAVGISIFSCPELIRCIRSKKTSDVNIYLFILLMTSSACFFISGFYNVSKFIEDGKGPSDWAFPLAVAIANVFSFLVPLTILSYKAVNVLAAKKMGITEKELEAKREQKNKENTIQKN